jgi:hypothetical protein
VALGADTFDSFKGVAAGWCGKLVAHGLLLPEATVQMKDELFTPLLGG